MIVIIIHRSFQRGLIKLELLFHLQSVSIHDINKCCVHISSVSYSIGEIEVFRIDDLANENIIKAFIVRRIVDVLINFSYLLGNLLLLCLLLLILILLNNLFLFFFFLSIFLSLFLCLLIIFIGIYILSFLFFDHFLFFFLLNVFSNFLNSFFLLLLLCTSILCH